MTENSFLALKEEYDKIKKENSLLKNEISKIKKDYQQIKSQKENFEIKIKDFFQKNSNNVGLQQKLQKITKVNATYVENILALHSKCKKQLENNKKLIQYINDLKEQNEDEQNHLFLVLRNVLSLILPLKKEIKQVFNEIMNENQLKSIVIKKLKEVIFNNNHQINFLQNELQLKEEENQVQEKIIEKLKEKIEDLNQKIEKTNLQFNSQLKSKENENKDLLLQIDELKSNFTSNLVVDELMMTKKNVDEIENKIEIIANESVKCEQENMMKDILIEKLKERIIELNLQLNQQKKS